MDKTSIYFRELDSLRFLAFALVLVHHSPAWETIPFWVTLKDYGWIGVDLFLCLSAFLFAKLLFVEYQEKGNINIGYFYLRRTLRIWPLYFIFCSAIFLYSLSIYGWNHDIWTRFLGLLTFTDNFVTMFRGYNYSMLFIAHLWTISYEEQFYLIIPWALRVLYRLKKKIAASLLGAAMLLGMIARAYFIYRNVDHPAIWVFPLTHFESIFGGLIIGLGLFDKYLKKISSWILLLTGLLALWLVTLLPNINITQWKLMLSYPLIGIGMTLLLFAVMQGGLGPISALLKNNALGYLGKISYGLYVYHVVGQELTIKLASGLSLTDTSIIYPITILFVTLIVTIAISTISYQLLEKPFLRLKTRFTFIHSRPI